MFLKIWCLLFSSFILVDGLSYGDQIEIIKKSNELYSGSFAYSKIYNDQFSEGGPYSFKVGNTGIYKNRKVKKVRVHNTEGELMFYCLLDSNGKVFEKGWQGQNYFVIYEIYQYDIYNYTTVTKYFKNNWLMKLDSVSGYYQDYKNADTSLYYSRTNRTHYLLGEIMNERNAYYNEKFFDKKIEADPNNLAISPLLMLPLKQKYYSKKFKTDYQEGKLYKNSHAIYTTGFHHYNRQTELNRDIINWHPFFKDVSKSDVNEFYVDGANFTEPRKTYERMYCGYSLNRNRYRSDNGVSYRYCKRADGLYDYYYLNYYAEDTTKIPTKKIGNEAVIDTVYNSLSVKVIESSQHKYIRRVTVPETTELFRFSYDFYVD